MVTPYKVRVAEETTLRAAFSRHFKAEDELLSENTFVQETNQVPVNNQQELNFLYL